jgi:NADH dehydrogenase [ubiquinone] 1 alpha subcomplex assembly factor 1
VKFYLTLLFFFSITENKMKTIYNFNYATKVSDWRIVNDDVMGGISQSTLAISKDGHGRFSGHVSLANYGGFASIQLDKSIKLIEDVKFIILKIKGDGKAYEFRIKGEASQPESYVHQFSTKGVWETIKLPINEFYPQFRGRKLNIPNFSFDSIEQISFLIANKQEEDFELIIDSIDLE